MKTVFAFIIIILFMMGCEPGDRASQQDAANEVEQHENEMGELHDDTTRFSKAIAVLQPTEGNDSVKGTITFTPEGNSVKVVADIYGLKPGKHGFHVHEFGDCSALDAESAGPHFNPMKHEHGDPTSQNRHTGDLGNIEADARGKAHLEWVDPTLSFYGSNSIIGRAVIVHENPDDLTTQPSGNAGKRLACGVIGISK